MLKKTRKWKAGWSYILNSIVDKRSGIYAVINKVNNNIYIGSALNFYKRWYVHLTELIDNKHGNKYLQRAFNKYGKQNFRFEIICAYDFFINEIDLLKLEQIYIDLLKPEYNIAEKTGRPPAQTIKTKEKTRKRFSKKWIVTFPNGDEKVIINLKKFCKENGLIFSGMLYVAYGKYSQSNGYKCRKFGEKKHKYINRKSECRSKNYIIMFPDGTEKEIRNLNKFCKENNLTRGSMRAILEGRVEFHKKFKIRYIGDKYKYLNRTKQHLEKVHNKTRKYYHITFQNGSSIVFHGLKRWCDNNNFCCRWISQSLKNGNGNCIVKNCKIRYANKNEIEKYNNDNNISII